MTKMALYTLFFLVAPAEILFFTLQRNLGSQAGETIGFPPYIYHGIITALVIALGTILWHQFIKKDKDLKDSRIEHKDDIKSMKNDWIKYMDLQMDSQKELAVAVHTLSNEVKENAIELAEMRGHLNGYKEGKGQSRKNTSTKTKRNG
jgi:hypothetical protein